MYDGVFGPKWEEFRSTMTSHFTDYPVLPARMPRNQDALDTLAREGVVILPCYLHPTTVTKLKEALHPPILCLQAGILNDIPEQCVDRHVEYGMYRLYDIDVFFKDECAPFKEDLMIQDIVQAYSSNQAKHCRMAVELRTFSESLEGFNTINSGLPHYDHIYREVKVFALLHEVTEKNAPMVYWTGTHRDEEWRWLGDYMRFNQLKLSDADGVYTEAFANQLERGRDDCRRVACTGPAGTVIIADVRGLHRATILEKGHRLQIFSQYRMTGVCKYM